MPDIETRITNLERSARRWRLGCLVLAAVGVAVIAGCGSSATGYADAAKYVEVEQARLDDMERSLPSSPGVDLMYGEYSGTDDPKYIAARKKWEEQTVDIKERIEKQRKVVADAIQRRDALAPKQ